MVGKPRVMGRGKRQGRKEERTTELEISKSRRWDDEQRALLVSANTHLDDRAEDTDKVSLSPPRMFI